jgi:Flp pilus assembly protein TadG
MRLLRVCRKNTLNTRGQTLVETSMALLVAIPVILWSFEMGMFCYTLGQYQYAARAGVQYAISHGTDAPDCSGPGGTVNSSCPDPTGADISDLVANVSHSSGHVLMSSQVKVSWGDLDNNPASPVTVTISAPYQPYVDLPFVPAIITGTATGQIVY